MAAPLNSQRATPTLLCLDLRKEWLLASATRAPWVAKAILCLREARKRGWRVLHAHRARAQSGLVATGAIEGLEPLIDEPVHLLLRQSAFEADDLGDRLTADAGRTHVIGAAYSRVGLATAMAAHDLGRPLVLLAEACGAPPDIGPAQALQIGLQLRSLALSVAVAELFEARTGKVVDFQQWRTATQDNARGD